MNTSSSLNSIEWQCKYVYLAEIENFKSRDLTDQEVIVMKWMEKRVQELRKRSP